MLNRNSFSSRKDQAIYEINQMMDKNQREKFSKEYISPDGSASIIIGVQPNGGFGINVYANNGDIREQIKNDKDIVVLPGRETNIVGSDNVKVERVEKEVQITLTDSFRVDLLRSVYPVGSVYVNTTDSRSPAEIMNWGSSRWEVINNYVIVRKDMSASDSQPEYETAFAWKRLA